MISDMIEFVAHRAGNDIDAIRAADAADTVEFDVHQFRRRIEVRHEKVFWPTRIQWERWWIDWKPAVPPALADAATHLPADLGVWLDVKGFTSALANAAVEAVSPARPVTVSSRNWWVLRAARRDGLRNMRSVGSRTQLWAVQRIRRWGQHDGIVIHQRFLTADVIERLRRLTLHIATWAVADADRGIELIEAGVGVLIIDDLSLIEPVRRGLAER